MLERLRRRFDNLERMVRRGDEAKPLATPAPAPPKARRGKRTATAVPAGKPRSDLSSRQAQASARSSA